MKRDMQLSLHFWFSAILRSVLLVTTNRDLARHGSSPSYDFYRDLQNPFTHLP